MFNETLLLTLIVLGKHLDLVSGLVIRVSGGEKLIGLPPLIYFPGFAEPTEEEVWRTWVTIKTFRNLFSLFQIEEAEEENRRPFGTQLFPFRTMAMIISMISLVSVSKLMTYLFKNNKLQKHQDIFKCIVNIPEDETQVINKKCSISDYPMQEID